MKNYVIPYGVSGVDGWWSGVDFYNYDFVETNIIVEISRSNGTTSKSFIREISPMQHYVLTPGEIEHELNDPDGRFSIVVTCSDDVIITPFIGRNDSFGLLKLKEVAGKK